ncbi:metalloregulator ArsR/SmtB family transcription factor [Myxococcota bacterium]|nr:metalloregulator ArsR/SmtB family transcription factor [Myxococcota bacterium]
MPNKASRLSELLSPRFFKALGDPNRIAILIRLATCRRPCSVRRVAECCPVDLSVVSRHLSTLRNAGILTSERKGKEVFYSVRTEALVKLFRELADTLENASCDDDCPCPYQDPTEARKLLMPDEPNTHL